MNISVASSESSVQVKVEGGARIYHGGSQVDPECPLVSIVCAVYNGEAHLENTLESILGQTYKNIEIIVIDGGSNDSTIAIIERYNPNIEYWVSESDTGIADAWNKGLKHTHGEIIGFLNSDDYYAPDMVQKAVTKIGENISKPMVSYGNTQMVVGRKMGRYIAGNFNESRLCYGFGFMHPSVLATRAAFDKVGQFNMKYKIAMDTDWLLRSVTQQVDFVNNDGLVYMRSGGVSENQEKTGFNEYLVALSEHGYGKLYILYTKYVFLSKLMLRKIIGKQGMDSLYRLTKNVNPS